MNLANEIQAFVETAADGLFRRFCPQGRLPRIVGGYRQYDRTDSALLALGARLPAAAPWMRGLLGDLTGAKYETWWSLWIAEALVATGERFDNHPLLRGFSDEQLDRLRRALDTTHIVDVAHERLPGHPNNYWMVLARVERARRRLGLQPDATIQQLAERKTAELLAANAHGFLDDCRDGRGRYDSYTFHGFLTTEAYWDALPAALVARVAAAHERLLLATARPDGGGVAWGRSADMTELAVLETAAALLRHGFATDRPRLVALAAHAFRRWRVNGWQDDAVMASRRGTHWYLGPFRLLERSLSVLAVLARAAEDLRAVPEAPGTVTFPAQDVWLPFDDRGPGVWCYRQGALDFQLPLVDGYTSDYVAAPVQPGFLEQPVDTELACGVPNVFCRGKRWLPLRRPEQVRWRPGELSWVTNGFTWFADHDWWKANEDLPGRRAVTVRVAGNEIVGEEQWTFAEMPEALGMQWAESATPLEVRWKCSVPHQAFAVAVAGMPDWRSYWRPQRVVHQLDLEPAREVRLRWRVSAAGASR